MEKRGILPDGEIFDMKEQSEYSIRYCRKNCQRNEDMQLICYRDSVLTYPLHTHADHVTFGTVADGCVRIMVRDREYIYRTGDTFCIPPDTPHMLKSGDGRPYSMFVLCIRAEKEMYEKRPEENYIYRLKRVIRQTPEAAVSIENMARSICVSPYHMIRCFKKICGLTPHQFQIQCRIRKAQELLEKGKSVTDTAYETGFCDQSHLDRCFHKLVGLTPAEYKRVVQPTFQYMDGERDDSLFAWANRAPE